MCGSATWWNPLYMPSGAVYPDRTRFTPPRIEIDMSSCNPTAQEEAMIRRILALAVVSLIGFGTRSFGQESPTKQANASSQPTKPSPAEIGKLIDQLGSAKFVDRQAASNRLADIGEPAWNALRKAAANSEELEIRRRAERLAQDIGRKTFI